MALIRCPDCGRKVSDKAEACPDCARPLAAPAVAEVRELPRAAGAPSGRSRSRPRPVASARTSERGPAAVVTPLRRPEEAPPAAPLEVTKKTCERCGEEFVFAYRLVDRHAYVCEECEERDLIAGLKRRALVRRILPGVLVLVALGAGIAFYWSTPAPEHDPIAPHPI